MSNVSDRLLEADPLRNEPFAIDEAHGRIRRAVLSAASNQRSSVGVLSRRRVVLGSAAGLLAALIVGGAFVGPDGQGTLQAAVRFEVRLAETQPFPGHVVARVGESDRLIYLDPEVVVSNEDVAQSWVTPDGPGTYAVAVLLHPAGAVRMHQATEGHIGRPVAIVIDGQVVSAPVVRSAVGDSATITGSYSEREAERIAEGIAFR